jgi:quercetin dioxygenase-like cupin family protein
MRATLTSIFLMCYSLALAAQTANVMPLASEPHHHLSFHNEYVNLYQVQVLAHDSVLLHRHDFDAISLMLSDSQVTVQTPGKPDVHRKLAAGQIRLQPRGYVHSTTIDGDTTYRNVTVELLLPQEGEHNLCFPVIPDKPLNCPTTEATDSQVNRDQVQFESNESSVKLVRILPHQSATSGHPKYPELVVALDSDLVTEGSTKKSLKPGDFVWVPSGNAVELLKNNGDKESHAVVFTFRPN